MRKLGGVAWIPFVAIALSQACGGGDDSASGNSSDDAGLGDATVSDGSNPNSDGGDGGDGAVSDASCVVDGAGAYFVDAIDIATSNESGCALRQDGSVFCWGVNLYGQLGVSPDASAFSAKPLKIPFPTGVTIAHITAGGAFIAALDTAGHVWAWGINNFGNLGDDAETPYEFTPVEVIGSSGSPLTAKQVVGGIRSSCAITTAGALECWGDDGEGITGTAGAPAVHATAVTGVTLGAGTTLAEGPYAFNACGVEGNHVACWGYNSFGNNALPVSMNANNDDISADLADAGATLPIVSMTHGFTQTCALDIAKKIFCFGTGEKGCMGTGNDGGLSLVPITVTITDGTPTALYSGLDFTCARLDDGTAVCFGANGDGQLGRGTLTMSESTPARIVGVDGGGALSNIVQISGSSDHLCARTAGACGANGPGPVFCWGFASEGILGSASDASTSPIPVPVSAP